jgi:magnesium transporter
MSQLESNIIRTYIQNHCKEVSLWLESMTPDETRDFLASEESIDITSLLTVMNPAYIKQVMSGMDERLAATYLELLSIDRAALILNYFPKDVQALYLNHIPIDKSKLIISILSYPENTAGSLMNTQVMVMSEDIPVQMAWDHLKSAKGHSGYYLYVVNKDLILSGVTTLRYLIGIDQNVPLRSVVQSPVESIRSSANLLEIIQNPNWHAYHSLPVVDENQHFLGVLNYGILQNLLIQQTQENKSPLKSAGMALGELFGLGLKGLAQIISSKSK